MMSDNENWRELPAGAQLDELICRKVGWSVTTEPLGNTATLWRPDLSIENTWGSSDAWPHVVSIAWNNAPRYSRDLNAAITLWTTDPEWSLMVSDLGGFEATYPAHDEDDPDQFEVADTPALAVCRAWLAWKALTDIEPNTDGGGDE